MTSNQGNAGFPALSGDGKLLAYSLQKDGAQDLYIKQVAGGQPIRLTFDGAGNASPDFSPDGNKIVFRSQRDGGGVYQIATFGGDTRLLARDGRNPRYSPDGSRVAFWIGDPGVAAAVPGNGTVWTVSSEGGLPRRIAREFSTARLPGWSSDGRHLLILGYRSDKAYEVSLLDRWVVPAGEGENAVQTGFQEALLSAGLSPPEDTQTAGFLAGVVFPEVCWAGNRLVFTARSGDSRNLWQTGISPAGKVSRDFQRLTAGAGDDVNAFCTASGNLVFARTETSGTVWSLPFDLNRGKPAGTPEPIVRQPSVLREGPSISTDGKRVAFGSNQSGQLNIWWHDDGVGRETPVAPSRYAQRYASVSPSGDRVAYSTYEGEKRILYVANPGGVPEKLCEGCLRATDWSSDEKDLLTFGGDPYRISLLDLANHQQTPLLTDPAFSLLYGRFSPDQHWISFTLRVSPKLSRVMIAPLDGPRPVPKTSWITISEEGPQDSARWSPDGKILYFTSGRDGHICLWGQKIDPNSHRPSGPPFALQHFHERPMETLRLWSTRGNRIAVVLTEQTSAIWMMSRPDTR
jgi:Tol biopolymer transport system component